MFKSHFFVNTQNMENNTTELAQVRTSLASKRTKLANVRTLLSYVRTSLILISVAFAFYKIEKRVDWVLITFGVLAGAVLVIGIVHSMLVNQFIRGIKKED